MCVLQAADEENMMQGFVNIIQRVLHTYMISLTPFNATAITKSQ